MTAHQGWFAFVVVAAVVLGAWVYLDGSDRVRRAVAQAKADAEGEQ